MEHPYSSFEDESSQDAQEERVQTIELDIVENVDRRAALPPLSKKFPCETRLPGENIPEDWERGHPDDHDQAQPRIKPSRTFSMYVWFRRKRSSGFVDGLNAWDGSRRGGQFISTRIVFVEPLEDLDGIGRRQREVSQCVSNRRGDAGRYVRVHVDEDLAVAELAEVAIANKLAVTQVGQELRQVGSRLEEIPIGAQRSERAGLKEKIGVGPLGGPKLAVGLPHADVDGRIRVAVKRRDNVDQCRT